MLPFAIAHTHLCHILPCLLPFPCSALQPGSLQDEDGALPGLARNLDEFVGPASIEQLLARQMIAPSALVVSPGSSSISLPASSKASATGGAPSMHLPHKEIVDRLINNYFVYFHSVFPIL